MTSSETLTDSSPARGTAGSIMSRLTGAHLDWLILGGLFVAGSLVILHANGWRWSAPVFVLFSGWLGILVSALFLWKTAMAAAEEDEADDRGFEVASTHRDDLIREKRTVLKAIKDIEFDYALDKMSKTDADELLGIYRRRAILIIKELEGGDAGSVSDIIDREVKARLAIESAGMGARSKSEKLAKSEGSES